MRERGDAGNANKKDSLAEGRSCRWCFAPGEAFQFDWSTDWAAIGGERMTLKVAHFKLSHSRAFVLRAYRQESQEMLFDAHNHALRVFGGVPSRGLYDNMKTAVDRIGRGKARVVNTRFQAMASHYLFEATFCNPASGWEKGQIEKNVQDARRRVWHDVPAFANLAALNDWLEQRCVALWQEVKHPEQKDRTIAEVWADELPHLMSLPPPFDGFVEQAKRVSPTCLLAFERDRYSVPSSFANRPVSLHVYAELPAAFKRLQSILLKRLGGDREMAEILALVLHHDEQVVLRAVELALDCDGVSKQHVLNVLARLLEPALPPPMDTPARLQLSDEPIANVDRYDALREADHAS
jgi:hypothetical protein